MTLIQKLPLGLALAACMTMSSCSQEDVQVVQPEVQNVNTDVNFKVNAPPYMPSTDGPAGISVFAKGWAQAFAFSSSNPQEYLAGTSTLTHAWGHPSAPWVQPLTAPVPQAGNFLTVITHRNFLSSNYGFSRINVAIKNLIPGKKYAITMYGASTTGIVNGMTTQYAKTIHIKTLGMDVLFSKIDLTGLKAQWKKHVLVFKATSPTPEFYFQVLQDIQNPKQYYNFGHLFVDQNSLKEI